MTSWWGMRFIVACWGSLSLLVCHVHLVLYIRPVLNRYSTIRPVTLHVHFTTHITHSSYPISTHHLVMCQLYVHLLLYIRPVVNRYSTVTPVTLDEHFITHITHLHQLLYKYTTRIKQKLYCTRTLYWFKCTPIADVHPFIHHRHYTH